MTQIVVGLVAVGLKFDNLSSAMNACERLCRPPTKLRWYNPEEGLWVLAANGHLTPYAIMREVNVFKGAVS